MGFVLAFGVLAFGSGCGGSLAAPFDQMKTTPVTVYRLQNFEPQQPAANAGSPIPGLPAVPPEIQKWLSAGATMLPPGLLPPGLIPGQAAPGAQSVERLYTFRVLGYMVVSDEKQHEEALDIFGKDKNFESPRQACMYPEFGFTFGATPPLPAGAAPPPAVLVSLSCNQVQAQNIAWPHGAKTGITQDTANRISAFVKRSFGG